MRVSYLGPEGTFSHEATLRHFGDVATAVGEESIEACFGAVSQGASDRAVVPYENSTEGVVGETMECLAGTSLEACAEVQLRIRQNLLARPGVALADVREVYSHPQSLAQCRGWLRDNMPGAAREGCASNAVAAKRASSSEAAAAVGPLAVADRHGLEVLAGDIEDNQHNVTRFLVMGGQVPGPSGSDKTTMVLVLKDRPGALYLVLKVFADGELNLTKLTSRPVPGEGLGKYMFFIDVLGHRDDRALAAAIDEIRGQVSSLSVIGSYPTAELVG